MAVCHARGCMVGCMGRISHTNLKNRMVIYGVATSKNHIELLVPGQIWDQFRDPSGLANSGLDSTFSNVETGSFWVTTRAA
jgi:hypothetical protein